MDQRAFRAMALESTLVVEITEAEFINVDHVYVGERRRIRREVPRLDIVLAHLQAVQVTDAVNFRWVLGHTAARPQPFDFLFAGHFALLIVVLEGDIKHVHILRLWLWSCVCREGFGAQDRHVDWGLVAAVFLSTRFRWTLGLAHVGILACQEIRRAGYLTASGPGALVLTRRLVPRAGLLFLWFLGLRPLDLLRQVKSLGIDPF